MAKRGSTTAQPSRQRREPPSGKCAEVAAQRVRLFEALGIIEVTRHALASKLTTLGEHSVIDALKVAYSIVDDVAAALEKGESAAAESAQAGPRLRRSAGEP
jgi:hypothetical protein